jgi:competence protein ComEC
VLILRLRTLLAEGIVASMKGEAAGVLVSLLLGDRKGLGKETRDAFARSGTIHVMAISGLHLMVLASALFFALWALGAGVRTRAFCIILFAAFFAVLTGLREPVVRAALMTSAYFGADLAGRKRCGPSALALAGGAILIFRPNALLEPGFQLSFAAVLSIGILAPRIAQRLLGGLYLEKRLTGGELGLGKRFRLAAGRSAAVSLAAWAGTAPIVLVHFNILTPVAVLANLLVIGPLFLLLVSGFLMLPVWALGISAGGPAGAPLTLLSDVLCFLVRGLAQLPASHVHLPSPPWWALGLYYAGILLMAFGRGRHSRRAGGGLLLCGAAVFLGPWFLPPARGEWRLTMLDVGQGSSFVVEGAGKVLVYDAGSRSRSDPGTYIIAPYLWHRGVTAIDLLVLSHADVDHTSGAISLAERFRIGRVLVSESFEGSPEGRRLALHLRSRGVEVARIRAPAVVFDMAPARVDVLFPTRDSGFSLLSKNDRSLVLRVVPPGGKRILLTGDLQERGIAGLLRAAPGLGPDVLAIPHHGSPAPRGNRRLSSGRPLALLSSGARFRVGSTLDIYRRSCCRVFWTARDGSVTVTFGKEGEVRAVPWTFRPVRAR